MKVPLIIIAIVYMALVVYFQSVCLGFSMLTFYFAVYWLGEAARVRPYISPTPLWWLLGYSLPVILSFAAAIALIGFALNVYLGGLVVAFEAGVITMGFLFAMMERG